jgi:hypothetical protein
MLCYELLRILKGVMHISLECQANEEDVGTLKGESFLSPFESGARQLCWFSSILYWRQRCQLITIPLEYRLNNGVVRHMSQKPPSYVLPINSSSPSSISSTNLKLIEGESRVRHTLR